MRKDIAESALAMLGAFALLTLAPCRAQSQATPSPAATQAVQPQSLGEVARELKAKRARSGEKPVKVYTNDDLKPGTGGISVVGPPPGTEQAAGPVRASKPKRDEQYYRERGARLHAALQMHQRELAVLQQKLSISQVQYYTNPNQTLHQEYSRSNIAKLTEEIDAKKQQIEADQKAIADLEQEVRREGGDPGWVRGSSNPAAAEEAGAGASHASSVEPHTRDEWQQSFKEARARLARAKEEQKLTEDELTLLQTQEARELGTGNTNAMAAKIADTKAQVDAARAATEQAQKELDDLERKFQQSGAPADWSQPGEQ